MSDAHAARAACNSAVYSASASRFRLRALRRVSQANSGPTRKRSSRGANLPPTQRRMTWVFQVVEPSSCAEKFQLATRLSIGLPGLTATDFTAERDAGTQLV